MAEVVPAVAAPSAGGAADAGIQFGSFQADAMIPQKAVETMREVGCCFVASPAPLFLLCSTPTAVNCTELHCKKPHLTVFHLLCRSVTLL